MLRQETAKSFCCKDVSLYLCLARRWTYFSFNQIPKAYEVVSRDVGAAFAQEKVKERVLYTRDLRRAARTTLRGGTQSDVSAEGQGPNTCRSPGDELLYLA